MSQFSSASNQTVSYCGKEVPLDEALDTSFKNLQENLNSMHWTTREMVMCPEQDNDYNVLIDMYFKNVNYFDDIVELTKELKKVCLQMIGKPSTEEEKTYFKKCMDKYKNDKKKAVKDKKEELDTINE